MQNMNNTVPKNIYVCCMRNVGLHKPERPTLRCVANITCRAEDEVANNSPLDSSLKRFSGKKSLYPSRFSLTAKSLNFMLLLLDPMRWVKQENNVSGEQSAASALGFQLCCHLWADCLYNVGTLTSHNPIGLDGLLRDSSLSDEIV
jgi:hypothetical protein